MGNLSLPVGKTENPRKIEQAMFISYYMLRELDCINKNA
jgi:hypothetical protein